MESTLTKPQRVINTPDQRLRVFISSTLEELANERLAAKTAVTNLHLTPVMFELGARPHPPRDLYISYLTQSHIFIGIYGEKYGWMIPELNISGLEDEFLLSANHPRLIYIKQQAPLREPRLKAMVDSILNAGVSCKFFSDNDELCSLIENDLALLLTERFQQAAHSSTAKVHPSMIPVPATPLIGRDEEVTIVKKNLQQKDTRLVTLTGTGGIGKTRMALELAHQLQNDFSDGVYFVPLASVSDAGLVPATIVQAIFPGELAGQPPLELLSKLFFGKKILLVLDNFEQVIGAAPFVADLLRSCEGVKVLVTSREILRISGEQEFQVPMLSLPGASDALQKLENLKKDIEQSQAVQLFIQRAKAIHPAFELTAENAAAVAEICICLDGLPLAIELAAARIRILSPQAMLPHLGKRLSLLTTGNRDLPERHRKLSATIDWSYLMLLPEEQQLLCKLSVFSGGCTMQSAFAIAGSESAGQGEFPRMAMYLNKPDVSIEPFAEPTMDFLELMESLAAKNLIYRQESAGEIRFMIYETIKEYAQQQLVSIGKKEITRKNHFNYFLRVAETLWNSLRGRNAIRSYQMLDIELDNMREALKWGLENDPVAGLRLALALGEYWDTRGLPDEQIWWTENFLQKSAKEKLETSAVMSVLAKIELARAVFREGKHDMCTTLAQEAVRISKQINNKYLFVDSVMVSGMVAAYNGSLGQMKQLMEDALSASRQLGYKMGTVNLLQNLAASANLEGRFADAVSLTDESLLLATELGATRWETISLGIRGFSQMSLGEIDASAASFSQALQCSKRFMDSVLIVYPLIGMAQVGLFRNKTDTTIKLMGAVEKLCERKGTAIVPMVLQIIAFIQATVKSQVGDEEYQRLYEIGCRLQLNEAIEIAEG